jgi:uncharacterized protein YecA (UPF0149 family)
MPVKHKRQLSGIENATSQGQIIGTWPLADLKHVALVPASARRLGRNQPFPCQSGRKFKRCCGPRATAA